MRHRIANMTLPDGTKLAVPIKVHTKQYKYRVYLPWREKAIDINQVVARLTTVKFILNFCPELREPITIQQWRKMFTVSNKISLVVDGKVVASVERYRIG